MTAHKITLIGTTHKEKGLCNSNELFKIIDEISPDVIYEELPPDHFREFYQKHVKNSLEAKAINKYVQKKPIPHIPVDIKSIGVLDAKLKNKISNTLSIFDNNPDYLNLIYQHKILTHKHGFPYLNSQECMNLFDHIELLEKNMVKQINEPELSKTYKLWKDLHEKRENTMLKNINDYGMKFKPKNALFLLGSAHRKSIIEKVKNDYNRNVENFKWIFDAI
ncbi:hypothetical protein [Winogradskyella sp.]|uniref:hypothetical protein n=1 Tax=Winogradskyella sp. TaxID=1883156 RepID=UPI00261AF4C7|nr:hypothetical protein [Winogradskyella sp.]